MANDDLDKAVIACISRNDASVPQIAAQLKRAYNTVLIRLLKMQADGVVQSEWRHGRVMYCLANRYNKKRRKL
jgi:predicted ArsR family transcriptional regulator